MKQYLAVAVGGAGNHMYYLGTHIKWNEHREKKKVRLKIAIHSLVKCLVIKIYCTTGRETSVDKSSLPNNAIMHKWPHKLYKNIHI